MNPALTFRDCVCRVLVIDDFIEVAQEVAQSLLRIDLAFIPGCSRLDATATDSINWTLDALSNGDGPPWDLILTDAYMPPEPEGPGSNTITVNQGVTVRQRYRSRPSGTVSFEAGGKRLTTALTQLRQERPTLAELRLMVISSRFGAQDWVWLRQQPQYGQWMTGWDKAKWNVAANIESDGLPPDLFQYAFLRSIQPLDPDVQEDSSQLPLVRASSEMQKQYLQALMFGTNRAYGEVLIIGAGGTERRELAELIHTARKRELVFLDCFPLGDDQRLCESKFNGDPGLAVPSISIFAQAAGRILFLHAVHHLNPSQQSVLVRVLRERRFVDSLGRQQQFEADLLILSISNSPDLMSDHMRWTSSFVATLDNLPHRLTIPPLCKRPKDIETIAEEELRKLRPTARFSDAARALLCRQAWPSNVRQLVQVIQRVAGSPGAVIDEQACLNAYHDIVGEDAVTVDHRIDQPPANNAKLDWTKFVKTLDNTRKFIRSHTAKKLQHPKNRPDTRNQARLLRTEALPELSKGKEALKSARNTMKRTLERFNDSEHTIREHIEHTFRECREAYPHNRDAHNEQRGWLACADLGDPFWMTIAENQNSNPAHVEKAYASLLDMVRQANRILSNS